MAAPTVNDFPYHDGQLRTKDHWNELIDTTVNIFTDGNYDITVNSITASSYIGLPTGDDLVIEAGENISIRDALVQKSDGKVYKADYGALDTSLNFIGFSDNTYLAAQDVTVVRTVLAGFGSLTTGSYYYIGLNGSISSSAPGTGYTKKVGYAIDSDQILFLADQDLTDGGPIGNVLLIDSINGFIGLTGDIRVRDTYNLMFGGTGTTDENITVSDSSSRLVIETATTTTSLQLENTTNNFGIQLNVDELEFVDDVGGTPSVVASINNSGEVVANNGVDLGDVGFALLSVRVSIGAWNLQSGADYETTSVAHGLSAAEILRIRSISVILISDDDAVIVPFTGANDRPDYLTESDGINGGVRYIDSTNVYIGADYDVLKQYPGGGDNWNDAVKNRGYITILYENA